MGFYDSFKYGLQSQLDPETYQANIASRTKALEQQAAGNAYASISDGLIQAGLDPNSNEYHIKMTDAAYRSGNPFLMEKIGLNYGLAQQQAVLNPKADPMLTDDIKEELYWRDHPELANSFMNRKIATQRAGATNIHMSPTMQMSDPNWANMPMDEKIATKVQWKDSANNGKWPTNGDYQSGALEMIGPINDENRTKGNAYLVYGTEGERTINPLYQKGGILSDKTRKGVAEGNWILDSSVRQAMKDQAVIDFAPDSLKKSLLSDQGKALNMGSDLVVEPNLRLMTGSAAGGTEHPRIKNMIAPNVYDSPEQAITKRAIVKMMNTYYKGMAAGFHVDPYAADDMLLGEVGEGSKKMALGYNHATGKIYYALPNGTKEFFTPEETKAFLEK